jgi:hydrogenase maturation factor
MKIGKIGSNRLKEIILDRVSHRSGEVLLPAGIGEDSAVVDFGDEVLVISSDPITGASRNAGYLAVNVACNDIAAAGARPIGIQVVMLLPETMSDTEIVRLIEEIDDSAADIGVEVMGGHTEVLSSVNEPLIVVTAIGKSTKDSYLSTRGAMAGDDLVITKGVGIEGIYILASDYQHILQEKGVPEEIINNALSYEKKISVIKEGLIAGEEGAHALHDITEGGLYGAVEEMSQAAGTGFELWVEEIEINNTTETICSKLGINPLGLISSGSLLISTSDGEELIDRLGDEGINAFKVGEVLENENYIVKNGERRQFVWEGHDELWKFIEKNDNIS